MQHDYEVGHYAYIIRVRNYHNLEGEKLGPFRITQVNTNSSIRIQIGIVNEQMNIWNITPHFGDPLQYDRSA